MDVGVAAAAGLLADRTRADLVALLDGRALTAGDQGRHRYYRLVDERAANAFESLAALAPVRPVRSLRQSRVAVELRVARTCYDHLAGQVAVLLADRCVETGVLTMGEHGFDLGDHGTERLSAFGLDLDELRRARRFFAHPCLDWSERRHHVAGALGAAMLSRMVELGWLTRRPHHRAVRVKPAGRRGLLHVFGCDLAAIDAPTG